MYHQGMQNKWEWVNELYRKPFGMSCLETVPSAMIMDNNSCTASAETLFPKRLLTHQCWWAPLP